MNRSRLFMIGGLALALGLLISYPIYNRLRSSGGANNEPGVDVVVAANDVQVGTKLEDRDIRMTRFPQSVVPPGAFTILWAQVSGPAGVTFDNVAITTVYMPLVRTEMIAPTKMYENVPTLSPEEAADLVVEAIVYKPVRIATRLGIAGAVCHAIAPRLTQIMLNTAFNMFPDSASAKGKEEAEGQLSAEQMAFAQLTQGIHW